MTFLSHDMTIQEHDHFIHYREQLQLAADDRKAEL